MLKTVNMSHAKKTAGCAVTYRSGAQSCYGTCPTSCALNPAQSKSTEQVDTAYLQTVLAAVPPAGRSFTYTHFHHSQWAELYLRRLETGKPTTTVNYSADNIGQAFSGLKAGVPTVIALPKGTERRVWHWAGMRLVRCPAEYQNMSCANCGGSKGPLCARPNRDYVIAFYGHGSGARHVGTDTQAGCYASHGNVRLHWEATKDKGNHLDSTHLRQWAKSLPYGTVLRHHVAGDMGVDNG